VRGPVRAQVARDLHTLPIQDVVVGPMNNEGQMVAFFTDLFGRSPAHTQGVELWRHIEDGVAPAPS
jgi:hypothetical protein